MEKMMGLIAQFDLSQELESNQVLNLTVIISSMLDVFLKKSR